MRYLSLFSGIEAASVAWHPLGWECVGVAEIEPFPCAVLAHHYPNVPNLGDVTKITEADIKALGPIDLVVFGSPCQDLSVAGHRKGLINADGNVTRSGLFFTAINIFHWSGARFALFENVPGAFSSSKGRDFASVVEFMAGLDEVVVPANGWGAEGAALGDNGLLEWCVVDAQFFGVPQRRRRVFALLDTGDWANRPPILLEPESLRGDSPPSRKSGEVAPTIPSSSLGGGGLGTDFDCDGGVIIDKSGSTGDGLPRCLTTGEAKRQDWETCNFVTHSLRGEGFDGSEDGTGRGTPLVPVAFDSRQDCVSSTEVFGSLGSSSPQAQAVALRGREGGATAELGDEVGNALRASGGGGDKAHVLAAFKVRRLLPSECALLQGFPRGYLDITFRNKPAADGNKYKALGNSMCTNVMAWIGRSIDEALAIAELL